jgi:hypothetical protein
VNTSGDALVVSANGNMSLAALTALAPAFEWSPYFCEADAPMVRTGEQHCEVW